MVRPPEVMDILRRVMLVDGFDVVVDLEKSRGARIVDARSGRPYLDMFTFVASHPLGMNHPRLVEPAFVERLGRVAVNKPSNSDIYTLEMAEFVDVFARRAAPRWMKHLFLIDGGTLAVENALKVAFDWKVRKNAARGIANRGSQVIHFRQCFHGRSGYSISMTNTDPAKTDNFPRFAWPRVHNPSMAFPCAGDNLSAVIAAEERSLREIREAIVRERDDIAALILEPIQGEGGDNHFRPEFFAELRKICDEHEIFLILDEVQTGMGTTGTWWAHEQLGVAPDAMAFGKKSQVCGIAVGARVDEVKDNCFALSSRINSTWGGNLVDMLRCARFIEVIEEERLLPHAGEMGRRALAGLEQLAARFAGAVANPRGRGVMLAFDLVDPARRPALLRRVFDNGMLVLPSGRSSVRLRPALNVQPEEIDEAVEILSRSVEQVLASSPGRPLAATR